MSDTTWIVWGVPAVALLLGGVNLLIVWLSSRAFDRRYPASRSSGAPR